MSMLNHDARIFYILLTQFTLERHDHAQITAHLKYISTKESQRTTKSGQDPHQFITHIMLQLCCIIIL